LEKLSMEATVLNVHYVIGSCRISDSLAQTKGGVVYRYVMPRPLDSRYATPTNSSYNMYVCVYARGFDY